MSEATKTSSMAGELQPEMKPAREELAVAGLTRFSDQMVVYKNADLLPQATICFQCGGHLMWLDGYGQMTCEKCNPAPFAKLALARWLIHNGKWLILQDGEYHPICRERKDAYRKKCPDSCGLIPERWVETKSKTGYPHLECGRCGRFIGYVKPPKL